jgi:hypothetical protein
VVISVDELNEEKGDLREITFYLQSHTLKNESED